MTANTLARHRFSIADFHRMAELGILPPDRCMELIEGDCVTVAPMGSWHMVRLTSWLSDAGEARQGLLTAIAAWCNAPTAMAMAFTQP